MSAISDKMQHLKDKLHHTKLHDVKVELIHKKHQVGKFGNLVSLVVMSCPSLGVMGLLVWGPRG
jgi:hypothetical protein